MKRKNNKIQQKLGKKKEKKKENETTISWTEREKLKISQTQTVKKSCEMEQHSITM